MCGGSHRQSSPMDRPVLSVSFGCSALRPFSYQLYLFEVQHWLSIRSVLLSTGFKYQPRIGLVLVQCWFSTGRRLFCLELLGQTCCFAHAFVFFERGKQTDTSLGTPKWVIFMFFSSAECPLPIPLSKKNRTEQLQGYKRIQYESFVCFCFDHFWKWTVSFWLVRIDGTPLV